MIAPGGLQPECLDARFGGSPIDTILGLDHGLRLNQAGRAGGEEIGAEGAVGPLDREVDPIEAVAIGMRIGGLGYEMRIVDFQIKEQIALGGSCLEPRGIAARGRQRSGIGRHVPILAIAVEQGLAVERKYVEIALTLRERLGILDVAKHPLRLGRQGVRDGVRARLERVLLRRT